MRTTIVVVVAVVCLAAALCLPAEALRMKAMARKQANRQQSQLGYDENQINAICTAWKNAGAKTLEAMTGVCDTLNPEYTVAMCKRMLAAMAKRLKSFWFWEDPRSITDNDCNWLKNKNRDVVDSIDWEDLDRPIQVDLESLDLKGRVGEEDEITPEIMAWNPNGKNAAKKVGIVRYGQTAAQSEGKVKVGTTATTIPLLAVTLDGIGPYPWHKDEDKTNENRVAIAGEFGLDNNELKKDKYGFTGIIEVVTGPVQNTFLIQHMKALKIFFKALIETTKCADNDADVTGNLVDVSLLYPDSYNPPFTWNKANRAVKASVLIKKYNTEVIKDHDLLDWKLAPVTYNYKAPGGNPVNKPAYEWLITCAKKADDHSIQVNFALPLDVYSTTNLEPIMGSDGKLYHKRSRILAARQLKDTDAAGDDQIKGLFTLLNFVAIVRSYNKKFQADGTAAEKKNEYDLLPKVNIPDLVRWLPETSRNKVKAWYDAKKDSFHDIAEDSKANLGISYGSEEKETAWENAYGQELEAAFPKVFAPNACNSRYKDETNSKYGGSVKPNQHNKSPPAECSYMARYLPAHNTDGKAYFMVETRLHPNFIDDLTVKQDTDYSTWSGALPGPVQALKTLQDT